MKTRIISAAVFGILLIPVFLFSDSYALVLLAQIITVGATFELLRATKLGNRLALSIPILAVAAALPPLTRISYDFLGVINAQGGVGFFQNVTVTFFGLIMLCMFACVLTVEKTDLGKLSLVLTLCFYITIGASSLVLLRDLEGWGQYIFILAFIAPWTTDTGAQLCGMALGKRKLIPHISPNKTVAGAVGGVIVGTLAFVIFGLVIELTTDALANYHFLAIAGAVLSVVVIMGDLLASMVKRHFGIKDFSNIMPGHGGIFDRFDSMIAAAPVLLMLAGWMPLFY